MHYLSDIARRCHPVVTLTQTTIFSTPCFYSQKYPLFTTQEGVVVFGISGDVHLCVLNNEDTCSGFLVIFSCRHLLQRVRVLDRSAVWFAVTTTMGTGQEKTTHRLPECIFLLAYLLSFIQSCCHRKSFPYRWLVSSWHQACKVCIVKATGLDQSW